MKDAVIVSAARTPVGRFGGSLKDMSPAKRGALVVEEVMNRAGSLDPAKIREALAQTNLADGPGMIVGYDSVKFDQTGQNRNASLVMVQVNDIGKGLERITVWPAGARRAGYKPVFPMQ